MGGSEPSTWQRSGPFVTWSFTRQWSARSSRHGTGPPKAQTPEPVPVTP